MIMHVQKLLGHITRVELSPLGLLTDYYNILLLLLLLKKHHSWLSQQCL